MNISDTLDPVILETIKNGTVFVPTLAPEYLDDLEAAKLLLKLDRYNYIKLSDRLKKDPDVIALLIKNYGNALYQTDTHLLGIPTDFFDNDKNYSLVVKLLATVSRFSRCANILLPYANSKTRIIELISIYPECYSSLNSVDKNDDDITIAFIKNAELYTDFEILPDKYKDPSFWLSLINNNIISLPNHNFRFLPMAVRNNIDVTMAALDAGIISRYVELIGPARDNNDLLDIIIRKGSISGLRVSRLSPVLQNNLKSLCSVYYLSCRNLNYETGLSNFFQQNHPELKHLMDTFSTYVECAEWSGFRDVMLEDPSKLISLSSLYEDKTLFVYDILSNLQKDINACSLPQLD